jgi:hypothetical protein
MLTSLSTKIVGNSPRSYQCFLLYLDHNGRDLPYSLPLRELDSEYAMCVSIYSLWLEHDGSKYIGRCSFLSSDRLCHVQITFVISQCKSCFYTSNQTVLIILISIPHSYIDLKLQRKKVQKSKTITLHLPIQQVERIRRWTLYNMVNYYIFCATVKLW